MRLVLALALLLAVIAPAQAVVIDSGSFGGGRVTDFSHFFNNMQGEGFSVTGIDIFGNSLPFQVTGIKTLGTPIDLSHTSNINARLGVGESLSRCSTTARIFTTGVLTGA